MEQQLHPDIDEQVVLALDYALRQRLSDYDTLSRRLFSTLSGESLGELYLLRAQLGLLTADRSFADDLKQADALLPSGPRLPPFLRRFVPQDPNGFVMFDGAAGSLAAFVETLHESEVPLARLLGVDGIAPSRQIESEILYFTGDVAAAKALALELYRENAESQHYMRAMLAGYVLLRCSLAAGDAAAAERVLLQVVKWVKRNPDAEYAQMYRTIRTWTNLTTGWGGDSPRYHITPDGTVFPALEDRIVAIQQGIAVLGPTEQPLYEHALVSRPGVIAVRELYMNIFRAMAHYRNGDLAQADALFYSAYEASCCNGLLMPFAEYGNQILPLLDALTAASGGGRYPADWCASVAALAGRYEHGLNRFRGG